jgi:hypothetical protein
MLENFNTVLLGAPSEQRLRDCFDRWMVVEYAEPMYNYLIYGIKPGSFFTAVLANDFCEAIQKSHNSNTISALKGLTRWITHCAPLRCYGSYSQVEEWCMLSGVQRRPHLESAGLIYTPQEETWQVLQNA